MMPETQRMPIETADRKAKTILGKLSLKEKIGLMGGNTTMIGMVIDFVVLKHYNRKPYSAGGLKKHQLPPVKFCDGPRGVVTGNSTCFPVAMARGASWDTELEERIGEVIGREIRALGGNYFGGVCINLLRHPAWGRAQETYGEDPYHLGEMGAALTRGVQKHNVMACIKHYALNSMENARFKVDVQLDERTLREVYLPHFKRCIDEGAASVMGAYNKVRGEHACHSGHLLKTILKEDWGFDGFTISDFIWGVKDTVAAANGGMEIEMPVTIKYGRKLRKAVKRGDVAEKTIDEAALRIIRKVIQFTESKDPETYAMSDVCRRSHIDLTLEAAEKGMTLLKNDNGVLPLRKETVKKLAVIGKLAAVENLGDHGSSQVHPPHIKTPLQGLEAYLGSGTELVFYDGSDLDRAERVAGAADAALVVVGYDFSDEGEFVNAKLGVGGDRDSLSLPVEQIDLVKAVAGENSSCVVAVIGGSPVMMEEWKNDVPSILMAWYPGMEGGIALAKTVFGEVNPGGKLPFTIPADASQLPFFDKEADRIEYGYYHGYTLYDKEGYTPAFPFGFGLSYTSFSLENPQLSVVEDRIEVTVEVTNTGDRAGDEVVQAYVGCENAVQDMPAKTLKGFQRLSLAPGETKTAAIAIRKEDLTWYNPETKQWEPSATEYALHVGRSSKSDDLVKLAFGC